jgi:hypothetical protein
MPDRTVLIKIQSVPNPTDESKPKYDRVRGVQVPTRKRLIVPSRTITVRFYDLSTLIYGGITDQPRQLDPTLTIPPIGYFGFTTASNNAIAAAAEHLGPTLDAGVLQYAQYTQQDFTYTGKPSAWPGNPIYDQFTGDPWIGAPNVPFFQDGNPVVGYTDEFYTSYLAASEIWAQAGQVLPGEYFNPLNPDVTLSGPSKGWALDSLITLTSDSVKAADQFLLNQDSQAGNGLVGLPPWRFDSGSVTAWRTVQLIAQGQPYREIQNRWELPYGKIDFYKLKLGIAGQVIPLTQADTKRWLPDNPTKYLNGLDRSAGDALAGTELQSFGGTQSRTGQPFQGQLLPPYDPETSQFSPVANMAMIQRPGCQNFAGEYWRPGFFKFSQRGSLGAGLAVKSDVSSPYFESFDTNDTDNYYITSLPSPDAPQVKLSLGTDVKVGLVPKWWLFTLTCRPGGSGHSTITITGYKRALTRPIQPQPFFNTLIAWPVETPSNLLASPFASLRSYNFIPDQGFSQDVLCAWVESSVPYLYARNIAGLLGVRFTTSLTADQGALTIQTAPTVAGALVASINAGTRVFYVWRATDATDAPVTVANNIPFNSVGDCSATGPSGIFVEGGAGNVSIAPVIVSANGTTGPSVNRLGEDFGLTCQGQSSLIITNPFTGFAVLSTFYVDYQTMLASGGTTPYTWSIGTGTLPPGFTLSSAGVISGTPSALGIFNFTVKVIDATGLSTTAPCSITVITGGGGGSGGS